MKRINLYSSIKKILITCIIALFCYSNSSSAIIFDNYLPDNNNYYYSFWPYLNTNLFIANFLPINLVFLQSTTPIDTVYSNDTTIIKHFQKPTFLKKPNFQYNPNYGTDFTKTLKKQPKGINSKKTIDSAGNVRTVEQFDSTEISYPISFSLDEYTDIRKNQIRQQIWDSLLAKHDTKKALSQGDLARLISQATGMTIPIPPNPVMSIFGKPELSINVSGEVNIRIGWRWDSQNLGTVSQMGQTQSTPMFNQDIRLNVGAKIGDKLSLNTDWNTRRSFDQDNNFKIGYTGYDDDIIKLVEVGYVNMPLPTSLIRGGEALFGVRADLQFGPLFLKTIFSQKRGETKMLNAEGGTTKQYFSIRAYDFSRNHFFLDTAYFKVYDKYFENSTPVIPVDADSLRVKQIEVWESTNDIREGVSVAGTSIAIADLPSLRRGEKYTDDYKLKEIKTGEVERGNFIKLDSFRYRVDYNLGTLHIRNLRQDRYYAVSYRTEGPTSDTTDDRFYGTLTDYTNIKDTLILKLIYRPNMQPGFKTIWERQMKNKYELNATNVNIQETKINIWYINKNNDSTDILEGAPDKLVTIFGVDQVNNSTGAPPPDGLFDLRPPFFDPLDGTITFPSSRPFDSLLYKYFRKPEVGNPDLAQLYTYSDIYDTTYDVAKLNSARDRFVISGEISGRASNRINLNVYNLSRGSVRVTLDGVPLVENQDFFIDYFSSTITFQNQRATLPNANLKIEYEQKDVITMSTKTLAGIRGDLQLYKSRSALANLGFTFMHYDQSAIIDRVRLGDEPVSNSMLGFDGSFDWQANWITEALDYLPFYDTKAPSNINLKGEWALMLPTPNKRTSDVRSDNGEAVVYIDDFEGAQRTITFGSSATQWQHSSQPYDTLTWANDSIAALYRGQMFWYSYFIPRIPIIDIYPKNDSYIQGSNFARTIILNFDPYKRGIYNKNPEFLDERNGTHFNPNDKFADRGENKSKIWGGMTKTLSSFNTNFDTENIEYIEIMMRVNDFERGQSKMYIDLGQISEDIIPNKELNTEDGITEASPRPNDIIDIGEDVGIDAIDNPKEKENYPFPLNLEDDPARDDYHFDFQKQDIDRQRSDFENYNNFEGNASQSEVGQYPDHEVLNRNNGLTISLDNSYFTYEVNLAQNENDATTNAQIVGGNPSKGWFLYRIPIRKPKSKVGNPLFSNVQYIRVRLQGGRTELEIESWRLVGSNWQRISNLQPNLDPNDSVLSVSFVNIFENSESPDFYTMPPGVSPPKTLNNPDPSQDIKLNEQSIAISVRNLRFGDERMTTKVSYPLDMFYYKKLKFFIHGDGSMTDYLVPGAVPKAYAFLRFGIDSSNYYEYRVPLLRGWQDLEILMEDLTAIKQIRDSLNIYQRQTFPARNNPNATYIIKGNPILTRVQFFGLGIINPDERFPNDLSTTMWVNELRLLNPESSADWSGIGSVNINLADLATINANFQQTQPNFHQLQERFGRRMNTSSWSFSIFGNLEKFAPPSFKNMKIPITYTHSEVGETPEYVANSDINLNAAASAAYSNAISSGMSPTQAQSERDRVVNRSQSLRVQDSWAITGFKFGIPINHWAINETFNKVTLTYAYAEEFERNPIYSERFNWQWRAGLQYGLAIPELIAIKPLSFVKGIPLLDSYSDWKLNLLPTSFNANINMNRRRQTEQSRFLDFPSPIIRDFSAQRAYNVSWKLSEGGLLSPSIDYTVSTNSTLVNMELDQFGRQLSSTELTQRVLFNNGNIIDFGHNNLHTQTVSINFKPVLPNIFSLHKYFDITGSFNTSYNWTDPMQPNPEIRDVVKSVGFNNSIRFNLGFRLKSLGDYWFGGTPADTRPRRNDTSRTKPSDALSLPLDLIKTIFFDWEKIDMTFTQGNTAVNPGVYGGTGMHNFWVGGVLMQGQDLTQGPGFAYQMGLVESPHGGFNVNSSSKFPFFGFSSYDGLRPANARLQDNFRQITTLEIRTSRPLWVGARLDLNWKTDLGFNKNQTVATDAFGNPTYLNVIGTESFTRTFLTFPSIFGFNLFKNDMENLISIFNGRKALIDSDFDNGLISEFERNQKYKDALSQSFYEALEAFSFTGGEAGRFLPAINWAIRWEGLEKFALWKDYVNRMTFDHQYTSTYQENVQITDNGRSLQTQMVQYGFQPLIGLNASFDEEKFDGLLTATLRWSYTNSFQINSAAPSIVNSNSTSEITTQGSYTMRGFEFPLFGINLKNDFELSFLFTYKYNGRSTYDITANPTNYTGDKKTGEVLDGNTQLIVEPRARYSLSSRLTASFFVRYEGTFTEGAAKPGFHTYQVGFDVRLSVSGGR